MHQSLGYASLETKPDGHLHAHDHLFTIGRDHELFRDHRLNWKKINETLLNLDQISANSLPL